MQKGVWVGAAENGGEKKKEWDLYMDPSFILFRQSRVKEPPIITTVWTLRKGNA